MTDLNLQEALQRGVQCHRSGDTDAAECYYTSILKHHPTHPHVNHNLGTLYVDMGRVNDALLFLRTAIEHNPNVTQFWLSLIEALLKLNKLDLARQVLVYAKRQGISDVSLEKFLHLLGEEYDKSIPSISNPPKGQIKFVLDLYYTGDLDKALKQCEMLLQDFHDSAILYNIHGIISHKLNRFDNSTASFRRAISLKSDFAEAYYNMGLVCKDQGKLKDALSCYLKATEFKPDYFEAYNNMGNIYKKLGKQQKAHQSFTLACEINPKYAEAYNNIGNLFKEQNNLDAAIEAYAKAINLKPDYSAALNNMGVALKVKGRLTNAIDYFLRALKLSPESADIYNNIGNAYRESGDLENAIHFYKSALALDKNLFEAYDNLGSCQRLQGNQDEALQSHYFALEIEPHSYKTYNNIGICHFDKGDLTKSKLAFKESLEIKPDFAEAHMGLAFAYLRSNNLKAGLREYEWRWKLKDQTSVFKKFEKPIWDSSQDLAGKTILLWCEQGIGDTLSWCKYLHLIVKKAGHCILECPNKLVPLLSRSFPDVEVRSETRESATACSQFDFHFPMGSLLKELLPEITDAEVKDVDFIPDPKRVMYWKKRLKSLESGPKVGIVWKSCNLAAHRLPNYASIAEWSSILSIPNVTFINLQYSDYEEDLKKIFDDFGVRVVNFDDLDHFNNIDDVAALCSALDCVVSTRSAVPFISSGVGTMTKLLSWEQCTYNNVLTNPSGSAVSVYRRNTGESWGNAFSAIRDDLMKL